MSGWSWSRLGGLPGPGGIVAQPPLPAPVGAVVEIERLAAKAIEAEVIGFRGHQSIVYPLGEMTGVRHGDRVRLRRTRRTLRVGPELLGRVVLMHPLVPFQPPNQPGLAGREVLITAGRSDPIAPAAMTDRLAGYFRSQGAATSVVWHNGGHEIRPSELAALQEFLTR